MGSRAGMTDFQKQSGMGTMKASFRGVDAMFRKNMSKEQKAAYAMTGDKTGYVSRSVLSGKQNELLKKALRQMGLSPGQMTRVMTNAGGGTPRQVIQSALEQAQATQDGGGNNG